MEFLLLPQKPRHPPLEVSVINIESYDGGDFYTYPERQGWDTRTVGEWQDIFRWPTPAFVAFLERWLLFGVIHICLGNRASTPNLIRYAGSPSPPVLTTESLPSLFHGFVASANSMKALTNASMLHARLTMPPSNEVILTPENLSIRENLIRFLSARNFRDPRSPEIAMATSAVLETLLRLMQRSTITSQQLMNTSLSLSPVAKSMAWIQLRQDGWCPSELWTIFHRFNTACFYFLHNLLRPSPHQNHQVIRIRKSARPNRNGTLENLPPISLCTPFQYAFKLLHDDTYTTKHAYGCNGCPDVVADSVELCEILKRGNIPLILSIDNNDENETIIFVESEPWMSYVSISHVWSDGLGNPHRNALPRCQLKRLSGMVRSLDEQYSDILLFWLDTICVPPDSIGMKEAQDLAISMMRRTYEDATTGLVLDSWLFDATSRGKSHVENLTRIFSSSWTNRLWTFQEGALAKALHVQFSDAAYDLDHGIQQLAEFGDETTQLTLLPSLKDIYHQTRGFMKLGLRIEERLPAIFWL
jgi:hypothetical protein